MAIRPRANSRHEPTRFLWVAGRIDIPYVVPDLVARHTMSLGISGAFGGRFASMRAIVLREHGGPEVLQIEE